MPGTALYFPRFNAPPSWYRLSLLYWDNVRRIVPIQAKEDVEELDEQSPDIQSLVEAKLILDTDTEAYLSDAEALFRQRILGPALENQQESLVQKLKQFAGDNRLGDSHVFVDKMSGGLREDMVKAGFLTEDMKWAALPSGLANLYMACLASAMAQEIKSPPVTHLHKMEWPAQYLYFPSAKAQSDELRSQVFSLLEIKFPRLSEVRKMDISTFIKIREETQRERMRFRELVEGIVLAASSLDDSNAARDHVRYAIREYENARTEYSQVLLDKGLQVTEEISRISCPSAFAELAPDSSNPLAYTFIETTGVTVSILTTLWKSYLRFRSPEGGSELRYLSLIQEQFHE